MNNYLLIPLKLFFKITSKAAPFIAIWAAEKLFTTPFYSSRRDVEKEMLVSADRFSIPFGKNQHLAGYRWGKSTDPIILFVHGWTATGTCFINFIDPLLDKGYQIISYDSVAHGETSGTSVSLTEWADVVLAAMDKIGKVHCIVGHSVGAGAVVIASSLRLDTDKIILISPVTDISKVTEQFAKALSIPGNIMDKVHQYAWKKYYASASKYGTNWHDVFRSEFKVPTLIIHDSDDEEIDINNSRNLNKKWTWAKFVETKRLGHRRILLNPGVINSSIRFITEPVIKEKSKANKQGNYQSARDRINRKNT